MSGGEQLNFTYVPGAKCDINSDTPLSHLVFHVWDPLSNKLGGLDFRAVSWKKVISFSIWPFLLSILNFQGFSTLECQDDRLFSSGIMVILPLNHEQMGGRVLSP